ncbi:MAG TPA: hypothetical protein VMN38_10365 [Sphingomicrobium sp.]|nr:hypothetical protein [Sphingomicrobium sp.]
MTSPIPVICDRCGATGDAGAGDFSDLLAFAPVPRKNARCDGWTPERQRGFIAALAATGSPRQAAQAIDMAPSGLDRLRADEGSESFRAAWDRALAIAAQANSARIAAGVAAATAKYAPVPPSSPAGDDVEPEEADNHPLRVELIEKLIAKFQRKVAQERAARLGGRIVEADFYLRQITALEVAFDLMIDGHGEDGWAMLMEARRGTRNLLEIADTHMARMLDQARRDQWAAMAEPGRPQVWPERYLIGDARLVDARTEPLEATGKASRPAAGVDPEKWHMMDSPEQQLIFDEQHRRDAEAQVLWEAEAASQATGGVPPRAKRGEGDHVKHGGGAEAKRRKKT